MVIWINGCFGVGKTTIAEELNKTLKNSFIYDPENLGAFLRDNLKYEYKDFQEYVLWRRLNYIIISDLMKHYDNIIIPMTLTNKKYYDQILGKLKKIDVNVIHIILEAEKNAIKNRLDKRPDTTAWSYLQVDRCLEAFRNDITGIKIDTNNKEIVEIVNEILNIINNVYY